LFPNIAPYASLSALATLGSPHFIPMTAIEPQRIADALRLTLDFFRRLEAIQHPESVYHLVSWNYMPASGSSLIHPHLQVFATSVAPNLLQQELDAAQAYLKAHGRNYWEDLVQAEKEAQARFLGTIGRSAWLTAYAPLGVAGDVIAVVEGARRTLELTEADISDLSQGLVRAMAAYDKIGIYSFNMSFFSGAVNDDHARFHLLFSPRSYFNPALGTPDVAALRNLFNESICMAYPEEINQILRPEFAEA
ncbi:MAG: hypothetical protein JSW39_04990, partial [Desulfobacterales bacterium]